MALVDLYQLTVMLKMQLPILFSFAAIRWFVGSSMAFWCDLLLPKFLRTRLNALHDMMADARRYMFMAVMAVSMYCTLRSPPVDVCGEYSGVRAQGTSCGIALIVLVTCGEMLPLAMALATLKSVADTSAASLVLAPATVLTTFAMDHRHSHKAMFVFLVVCMAYSVECYSEDHSINRAGGPILALVLMAMVAMVRTTARLWAIGIQAIRSGIAKVFVRRKKDE